MGSNQFVLFEDGILHWAATIDMAIGRAVLQIENADRAIRVLRMAVVIHERRSCAGESKYWQERANEARASASQTRDATTVLMLSEIAHLCNRMAKS